MTRVVVVIGTKGPFARLVEGVAAWARAAPDRHAWMQHGDSPLPAGIDGAALVPRDALLAKMAEADAVVVHAGSGTIRDALALGHAPVVVARRAARGEHVNDHQAELVKALSDRIVACDHPEDPATLERAIDEARARRGQARELPGEALRRAVGERLAAQTSTPARRTPLVWAVLGWLTRRAAPRRRDP
ncbi:MAG: hypothetical protein IT385_14485 [Deltaproteobacteria bacterium]|nr:hypothetical protein [Deltaproteobacteria bacterium]